MTTQYNVVTYGTLTNTNGVLSDFSASNYATIPLAFNPVQSPYKIVFKINTETMPTDAGGIIWQTGDVLTSRGRLDLEVSENKLYAEYAANGALVWYIEGITTLSSDTDYWVKLTYNGIDTYGLYLSTDGTTWTTEGTATSSGFLGDGTTEYNIIGVQPDEGGMIAPWFGSIDLNGSYININNIRWWQGVTSTSNVQTKIQLRHDTAANWTSVNPILLEGEVGIETDTLKQKVGDGSTAWNSLSYQNEIFVAEYNVTPFADIKTAYDAGKTILCKGNGYQSNAIGVMYRLYILPQGDIGECTFYSALGTVIFTATAKLTRGTTTWESGFSELSTYDLSNVSSIDSGSAVATALDAKVNKSGDTMTGGLSIDTDDNNRRACRIDNISTTAERDIEFNATSASHRVGAIRGALSSDGTTCLMTFGCCNPNNDALSGLQINRTNTSISCTFPNTTCVDGQWTNRTAQNIVSGSNITWTSGHNYDLSSYLPNDGHVYEVIFTASWNGSTAGSNHALRANTDIITSPWNWLGRISGQNAACGTCILPVGSGRYVRLTTEAKACNAVYFSALGYRRLGTNS